MLSVVVGENCEQRHAYNTATCDKVSTTEWMEQNLLKTFYEENKRAKFSLWPHGAERTVCIVSIDAPLIVYIGHSYNVTYKLAMVASTFWAYRFGKRNKSMAIEQQIYLKRQNRLEVFTTRQRRSKEEQ